MVSSFWNLTGILAAMLPRCLLNFKMMWFKRPISLLQEFARSCKKPSYWTLRQAPAEFNNDSFITCFVSSLIIIQIWHNLIQIKSMAEHLKNTEKLDSPRKSRFPEQFTDDILALVTAVTKDIVDRYNKVTRTAVGFWLSCEENEANRLVAIGVLLSWYPIL